MSPIDLPPKPEVWLPPRPAIIRSAEDFAAYEANLGTLLCAARRRATMVGQTAIPFGTGTAISANWQTTPGKAFDGVTTGQTRTGGNCARTGNSVDTAYNGKDWGAGNDKIITGIKIWGSSDVGVIETGEISVTINLIGHTSDAPASGTNLGTFVFTDPGDDTPQEKLSGFITTTAYRFHWLNPTASGGNERIFAEIEFYEG